MRNVSGPAEEFKTFNRLKCLLLKNQECKYWVSQEFELICAATKCPAVV